VLVAHWFLVHTFFVAVLSVDLQRLELEELLQQNASFAPTVQPVVPVQTAQSNGRGPKVIAALQGLLRGRATKNISLLLVRTRSFMYSAGPDQANIFQLLATTGTLYFVTYPATHLSDVSTISASVRLAQQRKQDFLSGAGDPAWHTWRMLNPREDPLVHLRIEAPTLLMFYPADATQSATRSQPSHRARLSLSYSWIMLTTARMARIVVLPIAATVAALYALLLYLLKDAERLEAQRHRAEPNSSQPCTDPPKAPLAFVALPRAHSTDIELLAVSADGRTAAGVSIENELVLWNSASEAPIALGAEEVLGAGPSNLNATVTALSLDDAGLFCAVGSGAGVVAIWALPAPAGGPPQRVLRGASSAVTGLHFVNTRVSGRSTPISLARPDQLPTVFATYENGTIIQWDGRKPDNPVVVSPPRRCRTIWSAILRVPDTSRLIAAFAIEDGTLEIVDLVHSFEPPLASGCCLQAGNPIDTVFNFHACTVELGGVRTLVIAAATEAGVVTLWDGSTSSCIALLDEPRAALNTLRVCAVSRKPCTSCGTHLPATLTLALNAGTTVRFFEAFLPPDPINSPVATSSSPCTCLHCVSPDVPPSTAPSTPVLPVRSRHASMSEDGAAFPISGHGVRSRRVPEKDTQRRATTDMLLAPESASDAPFGPPDPPHIPAHWRSLVISRIATATCDRGAWDVAGSRVVGLRRRSRKPSDTGEGRAWNTKSAALPSAYENANTHAQRACGLSAASLERWEAWTFDPADAQVCVSPLAALRPAAFTLFERSEVTQETLRLPFTRVRPLVSGRTCCLAGFGNTVGLLIPANTEKDGNISHTAGRPP
jgi:WD40 repeat protein